MISPEYKFLYRNIVDLSHSTVNTRKKSKYNFLYWYSFLYYTLQANKIKGFNCCVMFPEYKFLYFYRCVVIVHIP